MRKNSVYLGIIMLIFGIIAISGCVTDEKTATVETLGQLIRPSDLPEMTLISQNYMSVPNGSEFNISAYQSKSIYVTTYYDSTPNGSRNIGENFLWRNESGKQIQVGYMRYDTADGFNDFFEKQERACLNRTPKASEVSAPPEKVCHISEIGDHGIYLSQVSSDMPDITKTLMQFSRNNYFIAIVVDDENNKSVNETLSIAGIIDSRLPKNNLLNIDI